MIEIDRFNWNLARAFLTVSSLCSVLGIVCNSLIVFTTVKTKSLRSTCNILIAICAVGDVLHQAGTLIQDPLLFDIYLEIDSDFCILITFLPEMGIAMGCSSIMCIGLDRMISVKMPTRYKSLDQRFSVIVFGSTILGYCGYLCFIIIYFRQQSSVVCEILTPYLAPPGTALDLFLAGNSATNIVSTIMYTFTWLELRKQADPTMMKKIMKSLFIIVAVDVTAWILTPAAEQIVHNIDITPQQVFAWAYFCAWFINITIALKLFIYYFTSSEYRSAIRSVLFEKKRSTVGTSVRSVTIV